jgi:hypothetical protein
LRAKGRISSIIQGKSESFLLTIDDLGFRILMRLKGEAKLR